MSVCIETYKQVNLVEFLTDYYGLKFKKSGSGYVAGSPFGADKKPSFFVRQLGSHWLFKDFSSGLGGSIIDLVGHLEQLSGIGAILRRLEELVGGQSASVSAVAKPSETHRGYDVDQLYHSFREHDPEVCRRYLLSRGIDTHLVEALIADGEVVHNCYQDKSYCCFAVRDDSGGLQCLDNHEIDGSGKFVLGAKHVYSRDWQELPHAPEVFITEGIIDYLSMKTLEEKKIAGMALLGNQLIFEPDLLSDCTRIVSALDEDRGGTAAFVDLVNGYTFCCFILTTDPFSELNPLRILTVGAVKVTVAPRLIVTPLPIVIEILALHSQGVVELNVKFSRTTELSEQSGHTGGSVVVVVVDVDVDVVVVVVVDVDVVVVVVVGVLSSTRKLSKSTSTKAFAQRPTPPPTKLLESPMLFSAIVTPLIRKIK